MKLKSARNVEEKDRLLTFLLSPFIYRGTFGDVAKLGCSFFKLSKLLVPS